MKLDSDFFQSTLVLTILLISVSFNVIFLTWFAYDLSTPKSLRVKVWYELKEDIDYRKISLEVLGLDGEPLSEIFYQKDEKSNCYYFDILLHNIGKVPCIAILEGSKTVTWNYTGKAIEIGQKIPVRVEIYGDEPVEIKIVAREA